MPTDSVTTKPNRKFALVLRTATDGGYMVTDDYQPNMLISMLFASTTIDEALTYIKKELSND